MGPNRRVALRCGGLLRLWLGSSGTEGFLHGCSVVCYRPVLILVNVQVLAVWQSGSLAVWQSGSLAVWQSGSLAVWRSLPVDGTFHTRWRALW